MKFSDELNNYLKILNISTKELCNESGLSYAIVNRYINNKRTPKINSKYFNNIVDGLYKISLSKNKKLSRDSIYYTLSSSIKFDKYEMDYDSFVKNFNLLQSELEISTIDISKAVGYDASFISRLKNNERKPSNIKGFIDELTKYIFLVIQADDKKLILSKILNCNITELEDINSFKKLFNNWICSSIIDTHQNADIETFLTKLDKFNLNDYINAAFSKVKVPTAPIIFKSNKTFFGISGRKQAEGEFLKTTLLSKSNEPIFFYSDLPLSSAAEDEDFKKKWILAMTMLLKRGLHLNMVHNLNRPIDELLLGLENWIPIYMTGSISPYYFKTPPSNYLQGSICVSGSVCLTSECIKFNEEKSKFNLSTKKDDVEFEKEKAKYLLSKASPLMKIFKEDDENSFKEFMKKEKNKNIKKIKKDVFKNIDFLVNEDKWIMINKETRPQIHFVIYHEKLINSIKTFLL